MYAGARPVLLSPKKASHFDNQFSGQLYRQETHCASVCRGPCPFHVGAPKKSIFLVHAVARSLLFSAKRARHFIVLFLWPLSASSFSSTRQPHFVRPLLVSARHDMTQHVFQLLSGLLPCFCQRKNQGDKWVDNVF